MATLIPSKTTKADAPRNANEAHIATAREGMKAADGLWRQKAPEPAPARAPVHLSTPDRSTLTRIAPAQKTAKADHLEGLPQAIRQRAEGLDAGQKRFLALIHQRHAETGQPVSFTTADAATVMDLPAERAAKTVEGLESAGLIVRRHNSLGGLAGYVPGSA